MRQIAEFIAVLACALFTEAAVYVNLIEHPARMECGVELAANEFPPMVLQLGRQAPLHSGRSLD